MIIINYYYYYYYYYYTFEDFKIGIWLIWNVKQK